jgi:hypothetical protein
VCFTVLSPQTVAGIPGKQHRSRAHVSLTRQNMEKFAREYPKEGFTRYNDGIRTEQEPPNWMSCSASSDYASPLADGWLSVGASTYHPNISLHLVSKPCTQLPVKTLPPTHYGVTVVAYENQAFQQRTSRTCLGYHSSQPLAPLGAFIRPSSTMTPCQILPSRTKYKSLSCAPST